MLKAAHVSLDFGKKDLESWKILLPYPNQVQKKQTNLRLKMLILNSKSKN